MKSDLAPTAPARAPVRPWLFVPVLYLMQAMPATLVREVTILLYKDLAIPNARIALWVSLLALPWMLKLFWGPVVDLNFTRRRWVLGAQAVILAALAGLAVVLRLPAFFPVSLGILFLMAVASATHDIALDGLYLLALSKREQAGFVGVQSACFRAGRLLCTGGLVLLAGVLQTSGISVVDSWTIVVGVLAALYGGGSLYARSFLPRLAADAPVAEVPASETRGNLFRTALVVLGGAGLYGVLAGGLRLAGHVIGLAPWRLDAAEIRWNAGMLVIGAGLLVPIVAGLRASLRGTVMADAFVSFARQPRFAAVLAFILLYRFGEAMVALVAPLFLRDGREVGGMGLSVAEVGAINGVAGVVGIILGGIAGGLIISRYGLRRSFWPLVVCMHAPNLLYVWAAHAQPPTWTMYGVVFVDQFGYGFGFAAYSVYLMHVAQRSRYCTSHYAVATGLGSLCIALAGMVSSILQTVVGYVGFFVAVCVCTIPGMLTLLIIPLDERRDGR